jgi:hypothetical protein
MYMYMYLHIYTDLGDKDCPLEGQASQPSKRAKLMLQAANQPITTDAKGTYI